MARRYRIWHNPALVGVDLGRHALATNQAIPTPLHHNGERPSNAPA